MKESVEKTRRACGDLRIQRKEDFAKIVVHEQYNKYCSAQESSVYRRFMHKAVGKLIAKATLEKSGTYLDGPNKGYPKGFTNYQTYDKKYNKKYGEN